VDIEPHHTIKLSKRGHVKIFTAMFILILSRPLSAQQSTPYSLSWRTDGTTFGAALTVALTASAIDDGLPVLSQGEILTLNKSDVNPIDRLTAGWYSHRESVISDVLVGGAILSPLLFAFDPSMQQDLGTISVMYLETVMFATFIPSYGKGSVRRVRPFAYGASAPLSEKQDIETLRSFFSGHATWAFATSMFFANVYTDFHPDSKYSGYIWGAAIGTASAVSLLRVSSGAHFLSDIAVGAAVGSAIGFIIPYIHRTDNNSYTFRPYIGPGLAGASITFHLK
jgi:membrane-associated phospholipid phosphatase